MAGTRTGWVTDFMSGHLEVDAATEQAIATMESLDSTVVRIDLPESLDSPWRYLATPWDNKFKPQIEAYLGTLSGEKIDY
ncbi:MAG: hypothetical protein AAFO06_11905 [Cyanobacteria bacterium J06597_16]